MRLSKALKEEQVVLLVPLILRSIVFFLNNIFIIITKSKRTCGQCVFCWEGCIMLGGEVFSPRFIMCTQTNYTESSINSERSDRPPCLSWKCMWSQACTACVCVCVCFAWLAPKQNSFTSADSLHRWNLVVETASARPDGASHWMVEMKTHSTPFLWNRFNLNEIAMSLLLLLWFPPPPMIRFALELASKQGIFAMLVNSLHNG